MAPEKIAEAMNKVATGNVEAASDLAAAVKAAGATTLKTSGVIDKLTAAATNKKDGGAREAALKALAEISNVVGIEAEPYLLPTLATILEASADKVNAVQTAADEAGKAIVNNLNPFALKIVLPYIYAGMASNNKWQTKAAACTLLEALTKRAPDQTAKNLPEIVPVVSECMTDAKQQVKKAAMSAMTSACEQVGNRDIENVVPTIIHCIANPTEVPETIHKLSATTFVQQVEAPCLSILVPLLMRGLVERETAIKRKTCVIIDNMSKLVDDPTDAVVFLPKLLPGVDKVAKEVANPECRQVATRAHATLLSVGADATEVDQTAAHRQVDPKVILSKLKEVLATSTTDKVDAPETLEHLAKIAADMTSNKQFETRDWVKAISPNLVFLVGVTKADETTTAFLEKCRLDTGEAVAQETEEEEGEELCNCEFSLAYGGKILLNNAHLRLIRGQRYGLCGPNGAGKSTLMRAIANGQLEGFPPKEELRTVYVEHDIDASESETAVVEFIYKDPLLQDTTHPAHDQVESVLASVGFTEEMQQQAVGTLSGGWKMKLALARAMLMKADIYLLDEPTNHLDVSNVAWLEHYLTHLPDVTSMIVSHDSSFLDNVCTHIIHYESNRKLKAYKGNMSEFVKVRPEAKAYYELAAATTKFSFPEPGFLEGIKSKDKAIIKMSQIGFKYVGTEKQILKGVSIQCSLNSRVAVIGANGAGKSTMIKLLTGELEPQEGNVWKHPNMRIAYVAQHAFHHIEKHLDKTPNQYIQWRYAIGEDREALQKVDRTLKAEEEAKMQAQILHDGMKKVVEKILGRRKMKKSYEYEVQWVGMHPENNAWLSRDKLIDMGFEKMVVEVDMKEAARQGLVTKPLTAANIQKHLEDVGIEAEFGTHSRMAGLSGGQKVKVVIAAAMWQNPHILVLDEPTNYLDRESLGALAQAIRDFNGGVIMISHHAEFTDSLCQEQWVVAEGRLTRKGESITVGEEKVAEWKPEEEVTDAFGNVMKVKHKKEKMTNKEKKKAAKLKEAARKRGEEVSSDEEDY